MTESRHEFSPKKQRGHAKQGSETGAAEDETRRVGQSNDICLSRRGEEEDRYPSPMQGIRFQAKETSKEL